MTESQNHHALVQEKVFNVIRQMLSELDRSQASYRLTEKASLQKDLSLDSLTKVELFHRLEEVFNISLPDAVLSQAETVQDLIDSIVNQAPTAPGIQQIKAYELESVSYDPTQAASLVEVLYALAKNDPKRPHVYLQDENGKEKVITYGMLLQEASRVGAALTELGVEENDTVAIMLPTSEDFFYSFFGILLIGAIPVSIYPPFRPDRIEEYALREAKILDNAQVRILITFHKAEKIGDLLRVFIRSLKKVVTADELRSPEGNIGKIKIATNHPALIQYTSGSTSLPKGVLLNHENLLANIRAIGKAIEISPLDVGVSWLPLYHDMGLIGSWLNCFYHAIPIVIMSPISFLTRPERWLWAIHYHRGTLSGAPNFAYELCSRRIQARALEGLDLSPWRLCFNGAEQVSTKTLTRFMEKFKPYGFGENTMCPVYGLAESAVGLTFPKLNRPAKIDTIDRAVFEREAFAKPAGAASQNNLKFVSCGQALPDHEIRIVDERGITLPERKIGALQFRGPSSMVGYYRNQEATAAVYHKGWWDTGDLAYIAENELYITGRSKDIIIKAGRNLHPEEIEEAASQVTGVRKGCVIAFGVVDVKWETEKLVVVAETPEKNKTKQQQIKSEIGKKIATILDIAPDEVVLVKPRTIPKTSSGKLQRSECKALYVNKKISAPKWPVFMQVAKLYLKAGSLKIYRVLTALFKIFYTLYAALLLVVSLFVIWPLSFLLPRTLFNGVLKVWAKGILFLGGCPLKIVGQENLKSDEAAIYVANHASYIDAVVLLAALPKGICFVGKKSLFNIPILRTILKKAGVLSVSRTDFSESLQDTANIIETLKSQHAIGIFPEGTFKGSRGLLPFKVGAFKIATEVRCPVYPVAICGTREVLRDQQYFFKPHALRVTIGEALMPSKVDWQEVIRLQSNAHDFIAEHSGEGRISNT